MSSKIALRKILEAETSVPARLVQAFFFCSLPVLVAGYCRAALPIHDSILMKLISFLSVNSLPHHHTVMTLYLMRMKLIVRLLMEVGIAPIKLLG